MLRSSNTGTFNSLLSQRSAGRLEFRTPEDRFSSPGDVTARFGEPIESPAIHRAMVDWNVAKRDGDDDGLRVAALKLLDATAAAYRIQGVPTFSHPPLPPQFVENEVRELRSLPAMHRNAVLSQILDKVDQSARAGTAQQFSALLSTAQNGWDRRNAELPQSDREQGASSPFSVQEKDRNRSDRRLSSVPREQAPPDRQHPTPKWHRRRSTTRGLWDFHMEPGHEGWVITDEDGKDHIYLPERSIDVTGPDEDGDGQPDFIRMRPLLMY